MNAYCPEGTHQGSGPFCTRCGQPIQVARKASIWKKLLIWGGVAFCVLMLIGIIGSALEEDSETTPTPSTQRSEVTNSNSTLGPSPTSPSSEPCPTPSEQEYFDALVLLDEAISNAFSEFATLLEQVINNPFLFRDETWRRSILQHLDTIDVSALSITRLSGPSSVSPVRDQAHEYALTTRTAFKSVMTGIENESASSLDAASDQLERIGILRLLALLSIVEFCK